MTDTEWAEQQINDHQAAAYHADTAVARKLMRSIINSELHIVVDDDIPLTDAVEACKAVARKLPG